MLLVYMKKNSENPDYNQSTNPVAVCFHGDAQLALWLQIYISLVINCEDPKHELPLSLQIAL